MLRITQEKKFCPKVSKIRKLPLFPPTRILVVCGGTQCSEQKLPFAHGCDLWTNFQGIKNSSLYPDKVCVDDTTIVGEQRKLYNYYAELLFTITSLSLQYSSFIFSPPHATRHPLPATSHLSPATCYLLPSTHHLLSATCHLPHTQGPTSTKKQFVFSFWREGLKPQYRDFNILLCCKITLNAGFHDQLSPYSCRAYLQNTMSDVSDLNINEALSSVTHILDDLQLMLPAVRPF